MSIGSPNHRPQRGFFGPARLTTRTGRRVAFVLGLALFLTLLVPLARQSAAGTGTTPLRREPLAPTAGFQPQKEDAPPTKESSNDRPSSSECYEITVPGGNVKGRAADATPLALSSTMVAVNENEQIPNSNNTTATAFVLPSKDARVRGLVFPNADVDFYSFTGVGGERVYAACMTSGSANGSTDSQLRLFRADGTTLVEFDEDDGALGGLSSTIAGATLPATETYFLQVKHFSATNQLLPYFLYVKVQSGAPTAETEPNDTTATATPLPMSGWASGTRTTADADFYSMTLNAGDTVFLSLDIDPERDNVQWNGRLGMALFGDATNQILVIDDASTGSVANPLSEALFMTVKTAGTYFAYVDSAGTSTGTYNLSVSVLPAPSGTGCTTYTSTNVPQTIGPSAGITTSTLTVPGNPRIRKMTVTINLTHALMGDLDVELTSPTGNTVGLFTDIGAAATGGQTQMDLTIDDEAGIPPLFTAVKGMIYQPELNYRLDWFRGQPAGGTWTLTLRDDTTNASGGTLNGWSLTICDDTAPMPATTVFSTDFESGPAGFTHSGTADEWELGNPTFAPVTGANSGTNCWKTDLDGTYNASSSQDLLSPNINLAGQSAPIELNWAMKYQIESTSFDRFFVEVRQVGNPASGRRVFEWDAATMTNAVGNPTVTIQEAAGWGLYRADISSFAGQNIEVRFHLDSDTTVQLAGVAIDDVAVKSSNAVCGTPPTSNAGPDQTICATSAATLAANAPAGGQTGTWSVVSGPSLSTAQFGNVNVNNTTFTPASGPGTYTLRWSVSATGCPTATDDVVITVDAPPTASNAGPDQTICNGTAATLAANLPSVGTGAWSVVSGPNTNTSQFSSTTANNATFTPAGGAGTYTLRWTITATAACPASTDDVVITVQACEELSTLYVADTQNHRVQKYTAGVWSVVVGNGVPGIAANQCNLPEAVTASFDGMRIYVADTGNNRITYSTDGGGTWAVFASGPGIAVTQVNAPQGLALDVMGNLYVSDTGKDRVLRYAGGVPGTPVVLASGGIGAGMVKSPRGLTVDSAKNLYVADCNNNRVLKIAAAATVAVANTGTTVVNGPGIGLSQVTLPQGVAVDGAGNLYVADTGGDRVLLFTGGVAPGVVVTDGTVIGRVSNPEGVAVSLVSNPIMMRTALTPSLAATANLVVSDTGGNHIQIRTLTPGPWALLGTPNGIGSFVGMFRSPSKIR